MNKALKILSLAALFIVVLMAVMRSVGYRPMRYPADVGNSMRPTISPGDIWLCRFKRGYAPEDVKHGTVIIFPKKGFDFLLTKRVIALGDQTVEIKGQATFVDGERIAEPYAAFSGEDPSGMDRPRAASIIGPTKVPPGQLFVMGDNRDNSLDSRDPEFGFVDLKDIVGRPVMLLWARDKSRIGRRIEEEGRAEDRLASGVMSRTWATWGPALLPKAPPGSPCVDTFSGPVL